MSQFDEVINRRNTSSLKWDIKESELPMWVADMDFKTAPAVTKALTKRAEHGIFGYSVLPDQWYVAIQDWWKKRHDFVIEKQWLIFCTGIIPAVTTAVQRLTNVGDSVLVQTPVYNMFFHSIENYGRHVLENPLKYNGRGYEIDYEDLENKLSQPLTTLMLLCNPQNPAGKIWTKQELQKIGELCRKHHVTVLSDEIHCDLTFPGFSYQPFATASEICKEISVTCISGSKTFNIAGLQSAAVVIANEAIREKMERGLNSGELAEPNAFAVDGTIAAFTEGEAWLDELREYLKENKEITADYLNQELPELKLVESDATYLLWIDCSALTQDTKELCHIIREKTGLFITAGGIYRGDGSHFIRINIACPKATLRDGLKRLGTGIKEYSNL